MRPGTTHLRDTWHKGETLGEYATVDQGYHSVRRLHIERVEIYVVHTTGGAGEGPTSVGYYSREEAEAAAEAYMADPDGRGITQDWQQTT